MTGTSPVTTIHRTVWQSHTVMVDIVVTALVPVMRPQPFYKFVGVNAATVFLTRRILEKAT